MTKLVWNVNELLPYDVAAEPSASNDISASPEQHLQEIKQQMAHHIRHLNYAPGTLFWAKQLIRCVSFIIFLLQ